MQLHPKDIQHIQALFTQANSLLFTAGAGMGVDSGLPDFRGNQGMWQAYPELGKQRIDFSQIANPAAFHRHPHLAWGFYGHRLDLYRKTKPHAGFHLLQQLAKQLELPYFVFTSNVDGQFQQAGFEQVHIYECHGSIHYLQCLTPCQDYIWEASDLQPDIDVHNCHWLGELPQCPKCGGLARPNILMFDDWHWLNQRQYTQKQHLDHWLKHQHHPVVIEIGAGTAVPTVRYFSEQFTPALIRINPREYVLPNKGGVAIVATALEGVSQLYEIAQSL